MKGKIITIGIIWASIVSAQNKITISNGTGDQTLPAVCMGDSSYLVCWVDNRDSTEKIYGQLVSLSGNLERENFLVSNIPSVYKSAIAFDKGDNKFLVINRAWRKGYFVSPVSSNLDSTDNWISNDELCPEAVYFDGVKYFIVFYSLYGTYKNNLVGYFISKDGSPLDSLDSLIVLTELHNPTDINISFNGTNYLITWLEKRAGNYDVYGQIVSKQGVPIDTGFHITDNQNKENSVRVASDNINWFVVWESNFEIEGKIIHSNGSQDTVINILNEKNSYFPAVSFSDGLYIVTASSSDEICIATALRTGKVTTTQFLQQNMPIYWTEIDAESIGYLAVFTSLGARDYDLYGMIINNGIFETPTASTFRIISNPFRGSAAVAGYSGEIQVYDILGRKVESSYTKRFGYTLREGVYFVHLPNLVNQQGSYGIKVIKLRR